VLADGDDDRLTLGISDAFTDGSSMAADGEGDGAPEGSMLGNNDSISDGLSGN
jgi:hypothetical protein